MRLVDLLERRHAHGAAGAVDQLDLGGQQPIDAVLDDGVRLPPAHLHEGPRARHDPPELGQHLGGHPPVPVLVEVFHARRLRRFELTKETQLLEQRVGALGLLRVHHGSARSQRGRGRSRPRRPRARARGRPCGPCPPKSTRPIRRPRSSNTSMTLPGMARHIRRRPHSPAPRRPRPGRAPVRRRSAAPADACRPRSPRARARRGSPAAAGVLEDAPAQRDAVQAGPLAQMRAQASTITVGKGRVEARGRSGRRPRRRADPRRLRGSCPCVRTTNWSSLSAGCRPGSARSALPRRQRLELHGGLGLEVDASREAREGSRRRRRAGRRWKSAAR